MRSASTPCRKLWMMCPAVTAVRMAVSLRNTEMNTPLMTLKMIGGKNRQSFFYFCAVLPLDKLTSMWYNGIGKTGRRRQARPVFPPAHPICKISETSSDLPYTQIFSRNPKGRSVRHMRQRALGFNRHMILQRYLNRSKISSCEFR